MTGRPVTRERCATTISWLKGSDFPPKPPPLGVAMTRIFAGGSLEHFRERPVHVVRRLGRRPERQLSVGAEVGDRGVLLERQVRVALVEEEVLVHAVGAREPLLRVAELHRHELVDVGLVAVVVDRRLGRREAVVDRADRRQRLVVHGDEVQRLEGGVLVHRRDGGDRVADEADAIRCRARARPARREGSRRASADLSPWRSRRRRAPPGPSRRRWSGSARARSSSAGACSGASAAASRRRRTSSGR